LGTETIVQLSKHNPQHILFTGRNQKAADSVIQTVKSAAPNVDVTFFTCDFTSLESVKAAGNAITSSVSRLDLVFCNAGVMAVPKATTKDGYEIQFGINHLAHALLLKLLLPVLLRTTEEPGSDVRIVFNTSVGFALASTIDFPTLRSEQDMGALGAFKRYGQSKLANILYARQLAEHYPAITTVSIHPGVINTGLVSGLSTFNRHFVSLSTIGRQVTVAEGAKNQLWAATTKKDTIVNGMFYEPVGKVGQTTAASKNNKLAAELWNWTEEQMKSFL
jgi:NAD(P)-dependent dehydrogenase (short-subunit alcohol dehydrogenase family)